MHIGARLSRGSLFATLLTLASFSGYGGGTGCSEGVNGTGDADANDGADADGDTDTDADGDGDTDADGDADSDSDSDADCEPMFVDCTVFCGEVRDTCLDVVFNCGGCEGELICDIVTNQCVEPLVTCEDLEAECGSIRNSCGVRLDCGYCAADEECDPDTNLCISCNIPSCQDLGYGCGTAWNGCGSPSDVVNEIECGDCGVGEVCNNTYNLCEPDCVAPSRDEVCAQALIDEGVECGRISNGCGGRSNCGGCPEGEFCGVRGVANRCDPPERPLECEIRGWECGDLDSACEGLVNCGECPPGEVCRTNHICGPPCVPDTCETAYPGQCGDQLPDGCDGTMNCGCDAGMGCNSTVPGEPGTCEDLMVCDDYTTRLENQPCSNGASPAFPRGDGLNRTCRCRGNRVCIDGAGVEVTGEEVGTCCTNRASCDGQCIAENTCITGEEEYCCNSSQYCDVDVCEDRLTCEDIIIGGLPADGTEGAPCSSSSNSIFDDGSGTLITCPCDLGLYCVDGDIATADDPGYCCLNTNSCADVPLWDESCTVPNSCPGGPPINCCSADRCCVDGSCIDAMTCADVYVDPIGYADGTEGAPCSDITIFEACPADGANQINIRCPCGPGLCCDQPDNSVPGICEPTIDCDGAVTCEMYDPCMEANISCCDADQYCDTFNDICVDLLTCDDYVLGGEVLDGDLGDPCSDVPNSNLPAGDGSFLSCPCQTPPGWENITCEGDGADTIGTCACTETPCDCSVTGQVDGCGGILDCPCPPAAPVCDESGATPECCAPYECPGGAGGECDIPHPSCGTTIYCECTASHETCGGGGVDNECGCTPDTCRGRVGTFPDGCGDQLICGG